MQVNQCEFVKTNGVRCGSPALRGDLHCYFHRNSLEPAAFAGMNGFKVPILEDAETIQLVLTRVVQGLGAGSIEPARAKAMLYALQLAILNVKSSSFAPAQHKIVTDLTSEMLMNHWLQNPLSPRPMVKNGKVVPAERQPQNPQLLSPADPGEHR